MRLAGNVIWARPLIEKRQKQSAGKGGGGQGDLGYGSLDGASWSATPLTVLVLDKDVDPNSIDFIVTGVYQFRVGVKRSGTTNTLTSADLAFRKDGVSI